MLEVAGEQIESVEGPVRVVCNSELEPGDIVSARRAMAAQQQAWRKSLPEQKAEHAAERFRRLYDLLVSGKLEVKVLPEHAFGLIHGKAGVIHMLDGKRTAFMGSANDTFRAWNVNYELVWEDDSVEAVQWVQEEFDALWQSPAAFPLAQAVIEDIDRCARRRVIAAPGWRENPEAAAPIIETPVYRERDGLWAHQKYFVNLAFEAHRTPQGARYVLADMVGLGKTIQLGMAAMLMALWGDKPVLVIAPKPLLWQWQAEFKTLLDVPSAVWNGKQWVDENEITWPAEGARGIAKCPRRIGIVSQGLFSANTEAAAHLEGIAWEGIIVDEAHRCRRRNLRPGCEGEPAEMNNLMAWVRRLAQRTHSLLLATATPVQIHPVEAGDLLSLLATGREHVLGNENSLWRRPDKCLPVVSGTEQVPADAVDFWNWVRNPLPPAAESKEFEILRRSLQMDDMKAVAPGSAWEVLSRSDRQRLESLRGSFGREHSPFIRHIVRRTREFLETALNPETNLPWLEPVRVELIGERTEDALQLTDYLQQAQQAAEDFTAEISRRVKSAGFLKTLLLRRMGSTVLAGYLTAKRMLESWGADADDEADEESEDTVLSPDIKDITPAERALLEKFVVILEANQTTDPKYAAVLKLLVDGHPRSGGAGWLTAGCIIFSQFYDSAEWLAARLSEEALPGELIGLYAGSGRSALYLNGGRQSAEREDLKQRVSRGELRLVIGTDAASEGLNLQRLGTLINLDLPWNPTRLEQRKGRIQRIGQRRDTVFVANLRYRGSVEDRVHQLLSMRLENIREIFGQLPDTLMDVWISVAEGDTARALRTIDAVPQQHPFSLRYHRLEAVPWEACAQVLNQTDKKHLLQRAWCK